VPDKSQNLDHLGDALGYMVNFLYPVVRDYDEAMPQRFNVRTHIANGR
jgi:hypothetical protein